MKNLLKRLFVSSPADAAKVRKRERRRLLLEPLEARAVMTASVFLDFGEAFVDPDGAGPLPKQMTMTVDQLRNNLGSGGIQGPDLTPYSLNGSTMLTFRQFASEVDFDYNADGQINATDASSLRSDVTALVQRSYAPFDVTVTTAANSTVAGIQSRLTANNGLAQKKNDAYMLICPAFLPNGQSLGFYLGAYGIATAGDLTAMQNLRDDSALAFADVIFSLYGNQHADTATAFTTAHEAGHTFGLRHTQASSQLSNSDVMSGPGTTVNRENPNFFTRYALPADVSPPATLNAYNQFEIDPEIGLRPNAPSYVTGTGGSDVIEIFYDPIYPININNPFSFAVVINGTFAYHIFGKNDVRVELGLGDDTLILDPALDQDITVLGMGGYDTIKISGASRYQQYDLNNEPQVTAYQGTSQMSVFYAPATAGEADPAIERFDLEGTAAAADYLMVYSLARNTVFEYDGLGGSSDVVHIFPRSYSSPTTYTQLNDGFGLKSSDFVNGTWVNHPGRLFYNANVERVEVRGGSADDMFSMVNFQTGIDYNFQGLDGDDRLYVASSPSATRFRLNNSGNRVDIDEQQFGVWVTLPTYVTFNAGPNAADPILERVTFVGGGYDDFLVLPNAFEKGTRYEFIGGSGHDTIEMTARNNTRSMFTVSATHEVQVSEYVNGAWAQLPGMVVFNQIQLIESVKITGSTWDDTMILYSILSGTTYEFIGGDGNDDLQLGLNGATLHSSGPGWVRYQKNGVVYPPVYYSSMTLYTF